MIGLPTDWRAGWEPALQARSLGATAAIALYALASLLALRAARRASARFAQPAPAAPPIPGGDAIDRPRAAVPSTSAARDQPTSASRALPSSASRTARLWHAIALCLALLALARLFDLGNLVTSAGRIAAIHQGWYWRRRPIQFAALCALVLGAGLTLARVRRSTAAQTAPLRFALGGTVLLVAFALLRALSWHTLDRILGRQWHGLRTSWLLELSVALLVAFAAMLPRR